MPITVTWHDEQERILLEIFEGEWGLDDYMQMVDTAASLLSQKDHEVDIVVDFSNSKVVPREIVTGARYAEKRVPHNQGTVIFVNAGALISTYVGISKRLGFKASSRLENASSVDEAIQKLNKLK